MALYALPRTALAESDADGTNGSNIVANAVITVTDLDGGTVVIYDDAEGSGGATSKLTNSKGQNDIYLPAGEYIVSINGINPQRVTVGNPKEITTTGLINSNRKWQAGDTIETTGFTTAGDGGGGKWLATATTGLTANQTPADRGAAELTDGSGRLWTLVSVLGMYPVDALGAQVDTNIGSILTAAASSGVAMLTPGKRYYAENLDLSGAELYCSSQSTLAIVPNSTQRNIIKSSSGTLSLTGIKFNASGGSVGNFCVLISGGGVKAKDCEFTGAKNVAGYGDGVAISDSSLESSFKGCQFDNNGANGIAVQESPKISIIDCQAFDNVEVGFYLNNYDSGLTKNIDNAIVSSCHSYNNNTGFTFGNPYNDNDFNNDDFGYDNNVCTNVTLSNCSAYGNSNYGFVLSMRGGTVDNINSYDNVFGGILINGRNISIDNATVLRNSNFGVDIGHGRDISYTGGVVASNSTSGGDAFLIEASTNITVDGTYIHSNGGSNAPQMVVNALGGTGAGAYFPSVSSNILISAKVSLTGNRVGLEVNDNPIDVVDNSQYDGDIPDNYVRAACSTNNYAINGSSNRNDLAVSSSAGILVFPDTAKSVRLNETATLNGIETASYNYYKDKVAYITMSSNGSGYTDAGTTATISGDGAGATLKPIINNGQIVGIRVLEPGSGYTSATVNISGDGAGAAATAVIKTGLPRGKSVTLMHNQAQTITRSGSIVVENTSGADLSAVANGCTTLSERYGQWIVQSKTY